MGIANNSAEYVHFLTILEFLCNCCKTLEEPKSRKLVLVRSYSINQPERAYDLPWQPEMALKSALRRGDVRAPRKVVKFAAESKKPLNLKKKLLSLCGIGFKGK